MKKIAWVTSDCFIDCDFNLIILENITRYYRIDWYILLPLEDARYASFDFTTFSTLKNLKVTIIKSKYKSGDVRRIHIYSELYSKIKRSKADIYYINCPPTPYLVPFIYLLNRRKTIMTAHQGEVHKGFSNPGRHKLVRALIYRRVKYVNMFSPSQAKLFSLQFPNTKVTTIFLALKSFGEPVTNIKENQFAKFLVFGNINYGKHIDLLIEAACNIYEKGIRGFKVSINGQCSNWSFYQNKIKYPEIFDCDIRLIDNAEISNLFTKAHFLVQPYRIVTQSGPLKIAFNYNLPVICSDFPGFSDEVIPGLNGFLFEPCNVEELERKLLLAINLVKDGAYENLKVKMREYTNKIYSPENLALEYIEMFNSLNL